MSPEQAMVWAAIATGALSVGGIIVKEVGQLLRSSREGVKNEDVQPSPPSPAQGSGGERHETIDVDLSVVSNLTQVIRSMETEIGRLSRKQIVSDERIERIESEIEVERTLKWTAIQHIRTLYAWIARQLPGAEVPDVPEELAPHVVVPGKDRP